MLRNNKDEKTIQIFAPELCMHQRRFTAEANSTEDIWKAPIIEKEAGKIELRKIGSIKEYGGVPPFWLCTIEF